MAQSQSIMDAHANRLTQGRSSAPSSQAGDLRFGRIHAIPVPAATERQSRFVDGLYRVVEILAAIAALVIFSPLIAVLAILIRLDSPGPIFFFHKRPGRSIRLRGRDLEGHNNLIPPPGGYDQDAEYYVPSYFHLIKFRSMYQDSRTRFPECFHSEYIREDFREKYSHLQNDPRITRVGHILRKLSVDELPNLFSVVTGDLRLVGPRPEAPETLQYYTPEELLKFSCKPGITGLAQISGRGLLNWGETLALDLQYVHTRTVWLDIKIIFLTIQKVLTRHGAL